MTITETNLYSILSERISTIAENGMADDVTVCLQLDELLPGSDPSVLLRVDVKFAWADYSEVHFQDIDEELEDETDD